MIRFLDVTISAWLRLSFLALRPTLREADYDTACFIRPSSKSSTKAWRTSTPIVFRAMVPRPSVLPFRIGVDISNARRFARYFPLEQPFYDDAIGVPTHRVQLICMLFHKMFTPREQRAFWMRFLRPHSNMETAHNLTTRHLASR